MPQVQLADKREIHALSCPEPNFLPFENEVQYINLCTSLHAEHRPSTETEVRLVESIARHYWLMQRAIRLQDFLLTQPNLNEKAFALYLRYMTAHERCYYQAMHELQRLQEKAQKQQAEAESQTRKQEMHQAKLRLTNARANEKEIVTQVKTEMEAPLPGHTKIPFKELKAAFQSALRELNESLEAKLKSQAA